MLLDDIQGPNKSQHSSFSLQSIALMIVYNLETPAEVSPDDYYYEYEYEYVEVPARDKQPAKGRTTIFGSYKGHWAVYTCPQSFITILSCSLD